MSIASCYCCGAIGVELVRGFCLGCRSVGCHVALETCLGLALQRERGSPRVPRPPRDSEESTKTT